MQNVREVGKAPSQFYDWHNVMGAIILPDDTRDEFSYGVLRGGETKIPIAMVKFPKALVNVVVEEDDSEDISLIILQNRTEESTGGMEVSRYEFSHTMVKRESFDNDEELLAASFNKDGYVYLPKKLRDGRHEEFYFVMPVSETDFTYKVERGMFEEVAWSPFGTIAEAIEQEDANLERNPLLRRWDHV